MRPSRTVARAALTAALALGSLPGLVGSFQPSSSRPIDAAAFRQVILATLGNRPEGALALGDAALDSAAALTSSSTFVETDSQAQVVRDRASVALPRVSSSSSWKPAKSTMSVAASFYSFGTTAMRDVPRGTTIVICGAGGCIERIVSDYGPAKSTGRIIDMYKPDFFAICGCGWWSGTTQVTVRIY
jgi:hypothetical protein